MSLSEPDFVFTPGPWALEMPSDDGYVVRVYHETRNEKVVETHYVADVPLSNPRDRDLADAYLVAAAPDLYEALCDAAEMLDILTWNGLPAREAFPAIWTALAKARGES
jgi:hypothetical protein